MTPRAAWESEVDYLARLWHAGWQDAHAAIVPVELARQRTPDSFRVRMRDGLKDVRVIGPGGAPLGFTMLKGDELNQIYVAREARGQGVAAALIADAEANLAAAGVRTGWLACAVGNDRAARFYEKAGWRRAGTVISQLELPEGPLRLPVWRYEKDFPARLAFS